MKRLIQKFTERIYLSYARARCPNEMLDFSDCLAQTLTALILVPALPQESRAVSRLIEELQQLFPETHFSVLLEKSYAARFSAGENLQLITFAEEEDLAFHGLPKKKLQDAVRDRHFDLVIDLHEDFDLVAACLCQVSDAKLRVALQHPQRDFLYNFQVRVAAQHSLELKYDSLLKYLHCFKTLSHVPETDLMPA